MVSFHQHLARLTLTPRSEAGIPLPSGSIFLQSFALADGSLCLKASLSWTDSEHQPALSVYSTPTSNWKLEASRIATTWLEGPPATVTAGVRSEEFAPLAAAVG